MKSLLNRIEINAEVLAGKPVIKGTRLSVQFIVGLLASGANFEQIREEYPYVTDEDIRACLEFAANALNSTDFVFTAA